MPLTGSTLIEASAGTGKTFTMSSLYLRLLLQAGEQAFPRPLSVENILLVTFTKAATQELKERIINNIHWARKQLIDYQQNSDIKVFFKENNGNNAILAELVSNIDLDTAIQRLTWAEQNMDLAAIYTIHSFCLRALQKYAFNSGLPFELTLESDPTELYQRFAREYWRETFYPQSFDVVQFVHQHLTDPDKVVNKISSYLKGDPLKIKQPSALFTCSSDTFLQQHLIPHLQQKRQKIQQLKQQWRDNEDEIRQLFHNELTKKYKKGEAKSLNRNSFKSNHVQNWLNLCSEWAKDENDLNLLKILVARFSQQRLQDEHCEDNGIALEHPLFKQIDLVHAFLLNNEDSIYIKALHFHYIQGIRAKLDAYKANHTQRYFDDFLIALYQVLQGEKGEALAELIRTQYPFAMIDEFQDTDNLQYQIFAKIYAPNNAKNSEKIDRGFVMIGDPKQAIYKFRGADIFTYLNASRNVDHRFTLPTNYRSQPDLIQAVNGLFHFENAPFLYQDIQFRPVLAPQDKKSSEFWVNNQKQAALLVYQGDLVDKRQYAQVCANSIQQWLAYAQQSKAGFMKTEQEIEPLKPQNIAVLVRSFREANLIKDVLHERGISSVYLSDSSNVFDCADAQDLLRILRACLNPFNERHILNALASSLFALTADQILQIKQDEKLLDSWVNRFEYLQSVWQQRGVLAMLYELLLGLNVQSENAIQKRILPVQILSMPNGERRFTDILHLAELLQQAERLNESDAALVAWFERQLQGSNDEQSRVDEQQIRLESEQDLVKIVTIHKSKGLEYDVVWLPFIAETAKLREQSIATYYDEEEQGIYWDIDNQHTEQSARESLAEEMRLLYVALTRAKYQVAMLLPTEFKGEWNALYYALTQGEIGQKKQKLSLDTQDLLVALAGRIGNENIQIEMVEEIPCHKLLEQHCAIETKVLDFTGKIERDWQLTSFTSLVNKHHFLTELLSGAENSHTADQNQGIFSVGQDVAFDYDNASNVSQPPIEQEIAPSFSANFPRGIETGIVLHSWFEKNLFIQPIEQRSVEKLCQQLGLDETAIEPTGQWLNRILHTPLLANSDCCLAQLSKQDCLLEMPFYLNIKANFSERQFNQLLQQYHPLAREKFHIGEIKGMVRGFIDLIFRVDGKYYLLDYKSNFLGTSEQDYQSESLKNAMQHSHYDLQYLLYTLALHRYLTVRDPHYDYQCDFGGVIYAFLRGMNGENDQQGIFFDKPDWRLIEGLGELFYA